MNFYDFCTNFILNDNKIATLIIAPLEFINIEIMMYFISLFLKAKNEIKKITFLGIAYCINRIIFNRFVADVICLSVFLILNRQIFKIPSLKEGVYLISEIIFVLIFQTLFSKIICSFGNTNQFIFEIILILLTDLILINIFFLIKKSGVSIDKVKNLNIKYLIKISSIIMTLILILFIQALEIKNMLLRDTIEFGILNTITIILFFYIMISNVSKTKEIKQANVYIDNLEGYNKNLTEINDSIRGFKHDFNNIVQAINGYIMLEDIISLKKYFSRLLVECNQIKNAENLNPEIINNPAIYSLILNKYNVAKERNIKVNLEIMFDFSKITEYSYDISRILGILLDNAIEAATECEEKKINISFMTNKNIKYITIENTYKYNEKLDTTMIFEKNFTTKKKNGNTGLGLWEVKKILDKNKFFELYTSKSNKIFKQVLEIYEKPVG